MGISKTAFQANEPDRERIESWKQIAAYFGRDERTVKRWEQERGLPIHRMPGSRGGVFAYRAELANWLNSGRLEAAQTAAEAPKEVHTLPVAKPEYRPEGAHTPAAPVQDQKSAAVAAWLTNPHRYIAWLAGAAALALLMFTAMRIPDRVRGATVAHSREAAANESEARDFYLQGRYYWNRRSEDSLNRAIDAYTQAIVRDPTYAPAYAGMAETYDLLPQFTSMPTAEALPRAIAAARKAIALDDTLAPAHRALGWALFFGPWDVNGALAEYRRAIQLDPRSADSHHWYGNALLTVGRIDEARAEMETARRLDPASRAIQVDLGSTEYNFGDRRQGIDRLLAVEPDYLAPPRYLMTILFEEGELGQFIAQSKLAATISHDATAMSVAEAAERGWRTGGESGLLNALYIRQKEIFDQGQSSGFDLARTCVRLDRRHEAAMYFEQALNRNDGRIMSIFVGMVHDHLKDDAEFRRVEERVEAKTAFPFLAKAKT